MSSPDCGPADEVLLLATDTPDGIVCGERLKALIEDELGARTRIERVAGLQVEKEAAFREGGLRNLVRKTRAASREAASRGVAVAFNITGGFKGVVPYMTLLGMFERAEILYVLQEIDALIRLPALPLRMDVERVAPALPTLQALSEEMIDERRFDDIARRGGWAGDPVIQLLFERDGGLVCVSAAGELALEAPVPTRRTGRLLVHRRARREMGGVRVQRELPRLNDPGLRSIPLHHAGHHNSDFSIWKTIGPMAPRLFYWLDGDDVWLADILSHDDYEAMVLKGAGLWRQDYDVERFEALDLDGPAFDDPYPAALAEFLAAVDEARADLAGRLDGLEQELKDTRRRAERETRRHRELSVALEALTAPLVVSAAAFAVDAHATQKRKDGVTSYFEHLRAVARILAVEGGALNPEILAAGLLHDCIEDQQVPGELLEERFGPRVRALIEAVSDDKSLDKEERKRLQVAHAAAASADVALLKLADKIANLRDLLVAPPVDWPTEHRMAYVEWAQEVAAGLRGRGTVAHERLERAFDEAAGAARSALAAADP